MCVCVCVCLCVTSRALSLSLIRSLSFSSRVSLGLELPADSNMSEYSYGFLDMIRKNVYMCISVYLQTVSVQSVLGCVLPVTVAPCPAESV